MTNLSALDNPAWNALIDGHRQIAERNGRAARYPAAMSPIAGLERYTADGFEALSALVPKDDVVGLVTGSAYDVPDGWAHLGEIVCDQMVCEAAPGALDVVPAHLELPDVPAMVELATATEPGPFRAGTIGMGRYYGLKAPDGRLMAMAGERMRMDGLTEVSAVCTWPEFRGRGLAATLVSFVAAQIARDGRTPFLHVKQENAGAKSIYEKLGFRIRRQIIFRLVKRL